MKKGIHKDKQGWRLNKKGNNWELQDYEQILTILGRRIKIQSREMSPIAHMSRSSPSTVVPAGQCLLQGRTLNTNRNALQNGDNVWKAYKEHERRELLPYALKSVGIGGRGNSNSRGVKDSTHKQSKEENLSVMERIRTRFMH
jgi:hypothetical protein